jgi:hypothetical protein
VAFEVPDWATAAAAVLGGGAAVKLYDRWLGARRSLRKDLQARVGHLEATVDRLYAELGDMRERAVACEARFTALQDDFKALQERVGGGS